VSIFDHRHRGPVRRQSGFERASKSTPVTTGKLRKVPGPRRRRKFSHRPQRLWHRQRLAAADVEREICALANGTQQRRLPDPRFPTDKCHATASTLGRLHDRIDGPQRCLALEQLLSTPAILIADRPR
jgi:hypothetical protein